MKKLLLPFLLGIILSACADPEAGREEVEALMETTLREKIDAYRQRLLEDCTERILKEAGRVADSIIVAESVLLRDTARRPPIPPRPERPPALTLPDTLPVRPLLHPHDTSSRRG